MEFSELKKLAVAAMKAEPGTSTTFSFNGKNETYSAEQVNEALATEFKVLCGYEEGKGVDYRTYEENKNTIFRLIEQTISEVLPPRIEQNYMQFADVQRVGQGVEHADGRLVGAALLVRVALAAHGNVVHPRDRHDLGPVPGHIEFLEFLFEVEGHLPSSPAAPSGTLFSAKNYR